MSRIFVTAFQKCAGILRPWVRHGRALAYVADFTARMEPRKYGKVPSGHPIGSRCCCVAIKTRQDRDGRMANGARDEGTTQRLNYRHGEQAGADRMGGSRNGTGLPICSERTGSISEPTSSSPRGLHRTSEDERTVTTACLKPVFRLGLQTAEGFLRTGTRRISSRPGEQTSTQRPDTLTQTFSLRTFPLQSDGGPYISETTIELGENRLCGHHRITSQIDSNLSTTREITHAASLSYNSVMPRVLLNFQHYNYLWSVHFIEADCKTIIGPPTCYYHFATLDGLCSFVLRCNPENMPEFERSIRAWSRGGNLVNVTDEQYGKPKRGS